MTASSEPDKGFVLRGSVLVRTFLDMIKFEHTIFALPFAYLGMILAAYSLGRWPTLHEFIWITIAMAAARTLAMSFNRLADRTFDARNPRTADRHLPRGLISVRRVAAYCLVSLAVLAVAAWQINALTLALLPGAILFLLGYSYTKRFTWLSHWILGFTDGLAAMGAWVAVRDSVFTSADLPAWLLLGAVTFWIGGFDLIYACQDVEFDRREGLRSVPAQFGVSTALLAARLSHLVTLLLLAAAGLLMRLSLPFWLALIGVTGLMLYEHLLVSPRDLSKVGLAFFNVNGYISITLFVGVLLAVLIH